MDGGAWWAVVHGVAKSRTRLSDFPFTFHFHASERKCMGIPGMGGAWWAAVYGVAQSWTRRKRLSSSSNRWKALGSHGLGSRRLQFFFDFCACMLSCFSGVRLLVPLWTVACQVSLVHELLQAGILEWVALPSSRRSS